MITFVVNRMCLRMTSRLSTLLSVLLCLLLNAGGLAAETSDTKLSASDWLDRMQSAAVQTNYRGTFVFSRGEMSSAMQIVHRYHQGMEQERMKQLDGEMGEIIRNGSEVMCILPGNRVVKVEQNPFSNKVVEAFSGFMPAHQFYSLSLDGEDRLIERKAVKLAISANDENRYSYMLWLDQQTGLLMKSSLLDLQGHELERFHYTQLDFPDSIDASELKPSTEGGVVSHEIIPAVKKDLKWPGNMKWKVAWVPPGYHRIMRGDKPGQNALLYSDGLATYSVFVEQVEEDMMPDGASMVGALVAYSLKLHSGPHHYHVTVVGEIPAMTAMKVAESVEPIMTGVSEDD